jgi:chitodextrinase
MWLHPSNPLAPIGLKVDSKTAVQAVISWTAVTDSRGIKAYDVYKDGVKVASPTTPSYTATGLTTATTYKFKIKAVANDNMVSDFSQELSVTTS